MALQKFFADNTTPTKEVQIDPSNLVAGVPIGLFFSDVSPEGVIFAGQGEFCFDRSTPALFTKTTPVFVNTGWVDISKGQYQVLTFAAAQNWNGAFGLAAEVTLTGNTTLQIPTNISPGDYLGLTVIQGGAGSFTMAYDAAFKFPGGGGAPVLSTAVGAIDEMTFKVRSVTEFLLVSHINFS